jgi:hypothetical protein
VKGTYRLGTFIDTGIIVGSSFLILLFVRTNRLLEGIEGTYLPSSSIYSGE